jgi:uncharacterized phage infection (PIP) family protein YhgE
VILAFVAVADYVSRGRVESSRSASPSPGDVSPPGQRSGFGGTVRRLTPTIVLALLLALVAAGCGSSASAEEKWASSVCTAVGDWQDNVQSSVNDVKTQLQSPTTGTTAAINADVQSAVDATKKLSSDLKSIDPPSSDAGKHAQQELDTLSTQLDQAVTKTKQTVKGIPAGAGVTEIATQLATLVPSLQGLATSASTTLSAVKASAQQLRDGFHDADSCKRYP